MLLSVPKTKTKLYGDRSFAARAPRLNALPVGIKNSEYSIFLRVKLEDSYCRVLRLLLSLLLICIEYKQY